jgi:hypothetical protein
MAVTSAGLMIPSFSDGLVRYAPEEANPWQKIQAAGWNNTDGVDVTSSITLTPDLVALGLAHNGVALIDVRRGVLQRIGTEQGLTDAHIDQLAYNRVGGLWLALQNGVSLVGLDLPESSRQRGASCRRQLGGSGWPMPTTSFFLNPTRQR